MLAYWGIIALIPVGGTTATLFPWERNVALLLKRQLVGQVILAGGPIPGLFQALTLGASVMMWVFLPDTLCNPPQRNEKFRNFVIYGASLIIFALILNIWHPIIKHIWTSSFVLFSSGLSLMMLAVFYLLIDVWNIRKGTQWMIIIGSNAIFAYVAYHLFSGSFSSMAEVFLNGLKPWIGSWFEVLSISSNRSTCILYYCTCTGIKLLLKYKHN